jgi:hypothetical protein
VFDGKSISIAMDIQPIEGAGPVYLYPRLTATCNGRELEIDIEGCRGDFFSGFWVPEKDGDLNGQYGVDACIYEGEADGDVQWKLSFMVLKPNWELAYDLTVLHGDKSDPPMGEYMQRFRDAYAQKKILLAYGYSLVEFASIMPAPKGMTIEEYQLQRLGPQLAQSDAFTLAETVECTWNASVPASYTVSNSGDKLEFDDYTIVMGRVTTSFMKVTWAFDAFFKNGTGEEAGIGFEPRVFGKYALSSGGGYYSDDQLFDIDMSNELFHMYAGYGFVGAKEVPVSKTSAEVKYNQLREQLLSLVTPSEELDILLEEYERAAKEEYLLDAEAHKLEETIETRAQYRELVIPLHKQSEELDKIKVAAKIKLANYLMDNVKEEQ